MALAGQANAAIMMATYTGTIAGNATLDTAGVFGTAGADLSGAAFTTTYLYDTTLGGFIPFGNAAQLGFYREGGPGIVPVFGSLAAGPTSPMTSASLVINGVTLSIGGDFAGLDTRSLATISTDNIAHGAADSTSTWFLDNIFDLVDVPTGDNANFSGSDPSDSSTARAQFHDINLNLTGLDRTIAITCVSNCPAVPEPSTWAMMLVGFLGLGAALRRRRTTLAAI
ncbi:PEPxxWA-CTERM sorting domain-containing protein [Phenylobacterium sp.]|uniref:PEPxxWA-CTERM sorting domain-containing protein n=1 Tax=Phenylobacterium sp. TaxID=1871053 RepID=UPI0035640460